MPKKESKTYYCCISGKPIPEARVAALRLLGIPEVRWTCVEHSIDQKRKGIYIGESGTSELKLVDKVYDDSVRDVFKSTDNEPVEEED